MKECVQPVPEVEYCTAFSPAGLSLASLTDGNKLYEMYSDEEEWIISDILLLNSMTLSVQELEADGVTPSGKKFAYQRVE